jgi:hypothetical protein
LRTWERVLVGITEVLRRLRRKGRAGNIRTRILQLID